jgi:hypothetical protein
MMDLLCPPSVIQAFALLTAAKAIPILRTRLHLEYEASVAAEGRFRHRTFMARVFKAVRDGLSFYAFVVVVFGLQSGLSGFDLLLSLVALTGVEHLLGAVIAIVAFEGRLMRATWDEWKSLVWGSTGGAFKCMVGAWILGLALPGTVLDVALGLLVTLVLILAVRSVWLGRSPSWVLKVQIWIIKAKHYRLFSKRPPAPKIPIAEDRNSGPALPPPPPTPRKGLRHWFRLASIVSQPLKDAIQGFRSRGGDDQ